MLLKNANRIEALLFVYFLALWVEQLIQREVRRWTEREGLASIPLYPVG